MSKVHALEQLGFESQVDFRLYDNSDGQGQQMEWLSSDPQPSDAEITTAQATYDAKAYARTRATAYPSIQDFMEAYTEKEIGSVSTKWDAYVTAYNKVRTDNPK
jgi:hypothetical protein